jgi:hypothetical protein
MYTPDDGMDNRPQLGTYKHVNGDVQELTLNINNLTKAQQGCVI